MRTTLFRAATTAVAALALLALPAAATPGGRPAAETGDLRVHLAPAIVDVDQQVVVHATYQLADHPGGRPDDVGGGRPGRPEDDPAEDGTADDPADDATEDDPAEDGTADDAADDAAEDAGDDPSEDGTADDAADDAAEDAGDDLAEDGASDDPAFAQDAVADDPTDDAAEDDPANDAAEDDPAEDGTADDPADDAAEDDAADGGSDEACVDDEAGDDGGDDADNETDDETDGVETDDETDGVETDDDLATDDGASADEDPADPAAALREPRVSDDESDDAASDDDGACPDAGVTFAVDFGDGTVEDMRITKHSGRDGTRKAIARHRYAAEGSYTVTVTATPDDGEAVTTTVTVDVGGGEARLEGDDRIETAVRISQDTYPEDGSAAAVVLARADGFADALASAPLAVLEDGPVLLTAGDELPAAVLDEIVRVLAEGGRIVLLGGTDAIPASVEAALTELGYVVERIAGDDRIETALEVAEAVVADDGVTDGGTAAPAFAGADQPRPVVIASAGAFADALAAAAGAAADGGVVLLTGPDQLDPRVADFIAGLGDVDVTVMGGEAAVGTAVTDALAEMGLPVRRIAGSSRYETAVALAATEEAGDTVVLATGRDYPDAVAGAGHAARRGAPVLLVGEDLPEAVRAHLVANAEVIDRIIVLGGEGTVPADVVDEAAALIEE